MPTTNFVNVEKINARITLTEWQHQLSRASVQMEWIMKQWKSSIPLHKPEDLRASPRGVANMVS